LNSVYTIPQNAIEIGAVLLPVLVSGLFFWGPFRAPFGIISQFLYVNLVHPTAYLVGLKLSAQRRAIQFASLLGLFGILAVFSFYLEGIYSTIANLGSIYLAITVVWEWNENEAHRQHISRGTTAMSNYSPRLVHSQSLFANPAPPQKGQWSIADELADLRAEAALSAVFLITALVLLTRSLFGWIDVGPEPFSSLTIKAAFHLLDLFFRILPIDVFALVNSQGYVGPLRPSVPNSLDIVTLYDFSASLLIAITTIAVVSRFLRISRDGADAAESFYATGNFAPARLLGSRATEALQRFRSTIDRAQQSSLESGPQTKPPKGQALPEWLRYWGENDPDVYWAKKCLEALGETGAKGVEKTFHAILIDPLAGGLRRAGAAGGLARFVTRQLGAIQEQNEIKRALIDVMQSDKPHPALVQASAAALVSIQRKDNKTALEIAKCLPKLADSVAVQEVMRLLAINGNGTLTRYVLDRLKVNDDAVTKAQGLSTLGEMGIGDKQREPALDSLAKHLGHEDILVRIYALSAVSRLIERAITDETDFPGLKDKAQRAIEQLSRTMTLPLLPGDDKESILQRLESLVTPMKDDDQQEEAAQ
jgi:hypothetical protein